MKCQREDKPTCPLCGNKPEEPCPLTVPVDLPGEPVTAGTTGVCAVGGEECESCQ